jgi:hypothetical protein
MPGSARHRAPGAFTPTHSGTAFDSPDKVGDSIQVHDLPVVKGHETAIVGAALCRNCHCRKLLTGVEDLSSQNHHKGQTQ